MERSATRDAQPVASVWSRIAGRGGRRNAVHQLARRRPEPSAGVAGLGQHRHHEQPAGGQCRRRAPRARGVRGSAGTPPRRGRRARAATRSRSASTHRTCTPDGRGEPAPPAPVPRAPASTASTARPRSAEPHRDGAAPRRRRRARARPPAPTRAGRAGPPSRARPGPACPPSDAAKRALPVHRGGGPWPDPLRQGQREPVRGVGAPVPAPRSRRRRAPLVIDARVNFVEDLGAHLLALGEVDHQVQRRHRHRHRPGAPRTPHLDAAGLRHPRRHVLEARRRRSRRRAPRFSTVSALELERGGHPGRRRRRPRTRVSSSLTRSVPTRNRPAGLQRVGHVLPQEHPACRTARSSRWCRRAGRRAAGPRAGHCAGPG